MTESFPRLSARTRGFTLGRPRTMRLSPDGARLVFLRAASGTDPVHSLWTLDLARGVERCVVDAAALLEVGAELPPEERARRERAREQASGIVRYDTDAAVRRAVFSLAGDLWVVDLDHLDDAADGGAGGATRLDVDGPVVDPRLSPDGARIAWIWQGGLRVTDVASGMTYTLAGDDDPDITWGLADFIAAEEMGRTRGFWWSPEGDRILVARVDTREVHRWTIANPVDPAASPTRVAYPAAGTPNASVSLHLVGLDGACHRLAWDDAALPYLADVRWTSDGPALVTVQSRDQRSIRHLRLDGDSVELAPVAEQTGSPWLELIPGAPAWHDGALVTVAADPEADVHRVLIDGRPSSPTNLHIRELTATGDALVVLASAGDPTAIGLYRLDGRGGAEPLTPTDGVHHGIVSGDARVVQRSALDQDRTVTTVTVDGTADGGATRMHTLRDLTTAAPVHPEPRMLTLTDRGLRAALLRPASVPEDEPLPVLLDPYGGPHAQRVLQSRAAFRTSQWFADAGYAVLVVDGRGTPGRSLSWEHAVAGDLADRVLADQVDALHAAAEEAALDLSRVAIRGWSFGGYLAALAVLERSDVFHAAIAGAPVTDWRLYDTHYTERYLGDPVASPEVYDRNSLLPRAAALQRPLLLIHGLADDNVVVAHTLQLSRALLEAGRPHRVLPLSGVTHMTPQEAVAENLMELQADFLRETLGTRAPTDGVPAAHRS